MTKESDLKALMTASLQGDSIAHRSLLTALSGHLLELLQEQTFAIRTPGRGN